jgi:hypothetical protein
VTPQEREALEARASAEHTARAKWDDGTATIELDDLQHFSSTEVVQLVNAGRLEHLGVGRDKRLRGR